MEQTLIYQYVLFIGIAIGTASLIRKHVFFLTRVSSYSMVPDPAAEGFALHAAHP